PPVYHRPSPELADIAAPFRPSGRRHTRCPPCPPGRGPAEGCLDPAPSRTGKPRGDTRTAPDPTAPRSGRVAPDCAGGPRYGWRPVPGSPQRERARLDTMAPPPRTLAERCTPQPVHRSARPFPTPAPSHRV